MHGNHQRHRLKHSRWWWRFRRWPCCVHRSRRLYLRVAGDRAQIGADELVRKLPHGVRSKLAFRRETSQQNFVEPHRNIRKERRLERGIRGEGAPAFAENHIAQASQAEDIIAFFGRAARKNLRAGKRGGSDGAGLAAARRRTEIDEFHAAIFGNQHVRRLEVSVENAPGVRMLECLRARADQPQAIAEMSALMYPRVHGPARNELHADEPDVAVAIQIEHARYALVREALHVLELALQAPQRIRIEAVFRPKNFDRDGAVPVQVRSTKHDRVAALPDDLIERIARPQGGADRNFARRRRGQRNCRNRRGQRRRQLLAFFDAGIDRSIGKSRGYAGGQSQSL